MERIEDGRRSLGRVVPPEAYAAYAAGIEYEAAGQKVAARDSYDEARRLDPESGAAWAALGRVTCAEAPESALRTFADGLERAAERLPIWIARATCLTEHGELERALLDARMALGVAPAMPRLTELHANILERMGRTEEAAASRRALDFYLRGDSSQREVTSDVTSVDQALARGDFAAAERLSVGLLSSGELALRALTLGQTEHARALAALVLAAEPSNADAAVVLLVSGGAPRNTELAAETPAFGPLSPLGACLLEEYVGARFSAARWHPEPTPETAELATDPLLASCRSRTVARVAPWDLERVPRP